MKKKISSLILVFVICFSLVNVPKAALAEEYLTEEMAEKFVDLFYSTSEDAGEAVKDVLTGEETGTPELLKEILGKASTICGYAEGFNILSYEDQLKMSTISNVVTFVDCTVKIVDNVNNMFESSTALEVIVQATDACMNAITAYNVPIPTTIKAAWAAIKTSLTIGEILQSSILKEYKDLYIQDLWIAKYTGTELPSPIGYVNVIYEVGYSQKEVDAILSGVYMQFITECALNDLQADLEEPETTTYTITFNSNCAYIDSVSYTYDAQQNNWYVPDMKRDGYIFGGWYQDAACTQCAQFPATITENLTYYAKWSPEFLWTVSNGKITITGLKYFRVIDGTRITDIVIPKQIDGCDVVAIGNRAFYDNEIITSVSLPHGLELIEKEAFYRCQNMKEIAIPGSVVSIGESAFEDCYSITEIEIPQNVTLINNETFAYCSKLKKITIPEGVTAIGNSSFRGCNLSEIKIPTSVTSIGKYAFSGCDMIEVTIPDGVESIGSSTFLDCEELVEVKIPESVTSMGGGVFVRCKKLKKANLPRSITEIPDSIFVDCPLLEVTIPDWVTKIGEESFRGCKKLDGELKIPESITYIGEGAFGNTSIESVIWPSKITSIERGTFADCSKLKSIYIPDGVTNIGQSAFTGTALETILLPDSVEEFGDYAFSYNESLKGIVIPDGVTYISRGCFKDCINLEEVVLHDKVRSMGSEAFENCTSLIEINMPDSVKSIGNKTFKGCTNLKKVELSDSFNWIGDDAFRYCASLKEITLSVDCEWEDEVPFYGCTSLENIFVVQNCKYWSSIDGVLFSKGGRLVYYPEGKRDVEYKVPDGVEWIYSKSLEGNAYLKRLYIPDSVSTFRIYDKLYTPESLNIVFFEGEREDWNSEDKIVNRSDGTSPDIYYNCKYVWDDGFVIYDGSETTVHLQLKEEYLGKVAMCALYKNNCISDIQLCEIDEMQEKLSSTAEHDSIKVMIWDGFTSLKPATVAQDISSVEW